VAFAMRGAIVAAMNTPPNPSTALRSGPMLVAGMLALLVGVIGLLAWNTQASAMFMTLIENGLAWCF
jgi:hypothetical protein